VPFLPLIPRGIVVIRFRKFMVDLLSEPAIDRDNHRALIVALAGFSFAGLLGLVALPGALTEREQLPIWYVLISFLSYLGALNLQGYKARRWHDHVGDALAEIASLGLIASVMTFILKSEMASSFRCAATIIAAAAWISDFIFRLYFTVNYLITKERNDAITQ
jgi:hypothetical protein